MPANLLPARCILRAIQKKYFAVFHDGRGIEGGVGFPRDGGIRGDDRIDLGRLGKRSEHPRLLVERPAEDGEQGAGTEDRPQGIWTERDRRAITAVSGTPMSISNHATIGTAT